MRSPFGIREITVSNGSQRFVHSLCGDSYEREERAQDPIVFNMRDFEEIFQDFIAGLN